MAERNVKYRSRTLELKIENRLYGYWAVPGECTFRWEESASIRREQSCWNCVHGLWCAAGRRAAAARSLGRWRIPWHLEELRTCKAWAPAGRKIQQRNQIIEIDIGETSNKKKKREELLLLTSVVIPFCYLSSAVREWRPWDACSKRPLAWFPSSRGRCNCSLAFHLSRLIVVVDVALNDDVGK